MLLGSCAEAKSPTPILSTIHPAAMRATRMHFSIAHGRQMKRTGRDNRAAVRPATATPSTLLKTAIDLGFHVFLFRPLWLG